MHCLVDDDDDDDDQFHDCIDFKHTHDDIQCDFDKHTDSLNINNIYELTSGEISK